MSYIEGVPPLIIEGFGEIPPTMPEDLYLRVKESIAEQCFAGKRDTAKVVNDAYIAVPESEGGLGADSLDVIEIIMAVEDILGTPIPDDQAEVVGRVYHVAHLYNLRVAETQTPGVLAKWLEIRDREIDEYLAERGKTRTKKKK